MKNGPSTTQLILIIATIFVICFFFIFWKQIQSGMYILYDQLRVFFGAAKTPDPTPQAEVPPPVVRDPIPPKDEELGGKHERSIVEKILAGRQEVFNISKNSYTYYDAEPLCKALGADLATYEQVQEAYQRGADWCSYGWIKGQNAVFPTQQSTYDSLQKGSAEQRTACGKPGINGGYFDNPDLRFGVTCYGMKPDKSSTDALTNNVIELPPSTDEIEFEKKVQKFREQLDTTTVNPWNRSTWSSS
jgi:hypothetical protein